MLRLTAIFLLAFSTLLFSNCKADSIQLDIENLQTDNRYNPLGTNRVPVFIWQLTSPERGAVQTAFRIIVASSLEKLKADNGDLWDSKKVLSAKQSWIKYAGNPLSPGTKYFWKVKVWNKTNLPSKWSEEAFFVTGLFNSPDWNNAEWIVYEELPESLKLIPGVHGKGSRLGDIAIKRVVIPYFRKEFSAKKSVKQAFAFVSGLGHYQLSINGEEIENNFLSPGWTNYEKTCLYNTYDITTILQEGENVVGAVVGTGFYNVNRERYRKLVIAYGNPTLICKIAIEYSDGTKEVIVTDKSWETYKSPITYTSIFGGEDYDANLEQSGWNKPGFNSSKWQNATVSDGPGGKLRSEEDYPLKVMQTFSEPEITQPKRNTFIYDFGQNASGIIKLKVKGKKGEKVRLIPGELLDEKGIVSQRASGSPTYFEYTLKGDTEEIWTPKFTYYGFRYVQVKGAVPANTPNRKNLPEVTELQLLHTRNSSPKAGTFECSNKLFNDIHELINWAIKSNLASVTTDCPHREKLGWLEQTHLMGNSIKYNYDIRKLYGKIVDDMIESQLEDGLVPDIAPEFVPFGGGFRDSPEWGSSCVIVPWYLYKWYGDTEAMKKAYPMMKSYVSYLKNKSDNHILSHGLGDWFDLGPDRPGASQLTPLPLTATSIYYYDLKLISEMAEIMGKKEDAVHYAELAEEVRTAFNNKFFNPETKVYATGSQTSYSMPLYFDMVDKEHIKDVEQNLVKSINNNNKALTAGDVGYRYLIRALEQSGNSQLIFEMNSRNDVPGYGYQLAKGATALTESWPALKYVSNNHMMLGHLMEWLYSGLCGIRQVKNSKSYEHILIAPEPVGDITWAKATYQSIYGEILSSWKIENNKFKLKVKIPVGSKATILIPNPNNKEITIGGTPLSSIPEINIAGKENGKTKLEIESGEYEFVVNN
jgi:hypothetical protein